DAHQRPGLGLRNRAHLLHGDAITFAAGVLLVVRVDLGGTGQILAVHRVLFATLDEHGDGLVHLVADDPAGNGTDGLLRAGFHVFHFLYTVRLFASSHNQDPAFWEIRVFTRAMSFFTAPSRWDWPSWPVLFCMR